jgi:hypothetical protein
MTQVAPIWALVLAPNPALFAMKHVKKRMIEDMKLRGLAPRTQDRYLHAIKALAEHHGRPLCRITESQVRKYLLYLVETKEYAKSTFNIDLCAIKFLFRRTQSTVQALCRAVGCSAGSAGGGLHAKETTEST